MKETVTFVLSLNFFLPFVCRVASCCVRKLTPFFWKLPRLEAGYVDDELPIEVPKLACKYCTKILDFGRIFLQTQVSSHGGIT